MIHRSYHWNLYSVATSEGWDLGVRGGYLTGGKKDERNLRTRGFRKTQIDGEILLLGDLHEVETAYEEM
jgi:hypothetical protein